MNTSLWRLFFSPGQIYKSKVVGLCKCMLNFIRNCQSVSSVSVLFAKHDGSRCATSSTKLRIIDLFSYLVLLQWHFTTVLICICISDIEHFLTCVVGFWTLKTSFLMLFVNYFYLVICTFLMNLLEFLLDYRYASFVEHENDKCRQPFCVLPSQLI